jgi:hypothetical protein
MAPIERYVQKALVELGSKTLLDIQVETALTWCGRACAASQLGLHDDAIEYAHESIEHAALSGNEQLLRDIRLVLRVRALVA